MWNENRQTNKTLIWSATGSRVPSLSGWDIDVQLAGAQICVVSGSTDRNGRLWIVWIWGVFGYSKIFIASPVKKMWPLQVRCLKRSGFKHRPPVWDVAMSMLWMKRLSLWRWTIFSNLAQKPNHKVTITASRETGRWFIEACRPRLRKKAAERKVKFVLHHFQKLGGKKKVEFCRSIRVQLDMGFFY